MHKTITERSFHMSDENMAGGPTIIDNGVLFNEALRHITACRLEAVNVN